MCHSRGGGAILVNLLKIRCLRYFLLNHKYTKSKEKLHKSFLYVMKIQNFLNQEFLNVLNFKETLSLKLRDEILGEINSHFVFTSADVDLLKYTCNKHKCY